MAGYFSSVEEAGEWLDFECSDIEAEIADYAESDRYAEWQQWYAMWLLEVEA